MTWWETLGVERNAPLVDVRRALRRLQRDAHPDRGGDPERFRALREAYAAAEREQAEPAPVLAEAFEARPGADLHAEIDLPLLLALRGGEHRRVVDRGGQGPVMVTLKVPTGSQAGVVLRLAGHGRPGHPPGDLLLAVGQLLPHPRWRSEGANLIGVLPVRLDQAYAGALIDVEDAPWGPLRVTVPGRDLTPVRVVGHGWRLPGRPAGDLVLEPLLVWPNFDPRLHAAMRDRA